MGSVAWGGEREKNTIQSAYKRSNGHLPERSGTKEGEKETLDIQEGGNRATDSNGEKTATTSDRKGLITPLAHRGEKLRKHTPQREGGKGKTKRRGALGGFKPLNRLRGIAE